LKKQFSYLAVAGAAMVGFTMWAPHLGAQEQTAAAVTTAGAAKTRTANLEVQPPLVFQAAGPNAASIQSAVDQFRAALGGVNNGNAPGPLATGRREINWDGGGNNPATSPGPTPFQVFLATRGADITTPGTGFVQATPAGLADTFSDSSLTGIFAAFSPLRLFTPIGSNWTKVDLFQPGTGTVPAETTGFGIVFSDVDNTNSTRVKYFDAYGNLIYQIHVPASPGVATFSFVGVKFTDARIRSVQIVTGNQIIREGIKRKRDLVVMDDFIYGEPQVTQ
jgi:hypothetical protein